jgi:hypothetical protein
VIKVAKYSDIALVALIAFIAWKFKDMFNLGSNVVKETIETVYKSGQETGTAIGNWYNELFVYSQFAEDTLTKWTSQGYTQYGNKEYTWTEKNQITNQLMDAGYTVTSQAKHAGTVNFEQDIWLIFYKAPATTQQISQIKQAQTYLETGKSYNPFTQTWF